MLHGAAYRFLSGALNEALLQRRTLEIIQPASTAF